MKKIIFINIIIINRFQRDLLCVLMEEAAVAGQTSQFSGNKIQNTSIHRIGGEEKS